MIFRMHHLITLLMFTTFLLSGCSGCHQKDLPELYDPYNQSAWGPVSASTRTAVELPSFEDPSFEKLIEQFKVDVAENKGDAEVLKRKKEVIANPDLLWKPGFSVPPKSYYDPELTLAQRIENIKTSESDVTYGEEIKFLRHDETKESLRIGFYDVPGVPNGKYFDFPGEVFWTTEDQEARMAAVSTKLPKDAYQQKQYDILLEGIDAFTSAKYLVDTRWGLAYAEPLMRDHPNSVVAMHLWVRSHLNKEEKIRAYEQLLKKFPNAAFAYKEKAWLYYNRGRAPAALFYIQKACQLDSRIAKRSPLLAKCYAKLGQWKEAVAAYQGMSWIKHGLVGLGFPTNGLEEAQDEIYKQRYGRSSFGQGRMPKKYILDEKTGKFILNERWDEGWEARSNEIRKEKEASKE